jgi:hypothetical protein
MSALEVTMNTRAIRIALFLLALAELGLAQPLLRVPQLSPRAHAEETVGITDVSIDYHRPAVNSRRIWGGLVPYDVIWRAGANENTVVSFSTPVTVEGQPLAAGKYSFFLIPGKQEWTVVFNRFTGGWGTYSYDPSEDVLRVKVTPQPAEMQDRLLYTFDDTKNDAARFALRNGQTDAALEFADHSISLTPDVQNLRAKAAVV